MTTETLTIAVDFNNRVAGSSINDFTCRYSDNWHIKRLALVGAVISNKEYTIDARINTIQTNLGAAALQFPREYDIVALMALIQAELISIGHAGCVVSLNAAGKVQIACAVAMSIVVNQYSAFTRLGFTQSQGLATVLVADTTPLSNLLPAVYIQLSEGNKTVRMPTDNMLRCTYVVPIDRETSETRFKDREGTQVAEVGNRIYDLQVKLLDGNGKSLALEGQQCLLILRAWC
jgi:hypothetical protein